MEEKTNFTFPSDFIWGTSTAAAQIETAKGHPWKGVKALDGSLFERTIDHEKRRLEDAELIAPLGSVYRCGVDWSSLQKEAFAPFETDVVQSYQAFFSALEQKGTQILFVLHHFCHPNWFENTGGWTQASNIPAFLDYVQKCIEHFGDYVCNWNTFNEPNVFVMNAYILGNFPPFKKNYFTANKVLKIMGKAHDQAYDLIKKSKFSDLPIGISFNTACFKALNIWGKIPAAFTHWWFLKKAAKPFEKVDYWGISYYALVLFNPFPVTEVDQPGLLKKLGYRHDKMWAYHPQGLEDILQYFSQKYRKPILITENGICSEDSLERIESIRDYLRVCKKVILSGVDLMGYIHWSTFDNFEWHLGNTYSFGLISVDMQSMERSWTPAASFYSKICTSQSIDL